MLNAMKFLREGSYTNHGSKKDDNGRYQDEIVPMGDWSVWFYHANPIAAFNRETGELLRSACRWQSVTTKARLNSLPGSHISQKKGEWYEKGDAFKDEAERIKEIIGRESYHRIDGWRGYNIPTFAVAGSSDTGSWSDSPCPTDSVEGEVKRVQAILAEHKIRSYLCWTETSNVFCIKRWVCVKGVDFREASLALRARGETFHYVHVETDVSFD